ncbi:MAG: AAA family ATPase [Vicinamibacterales bacterium]
MADGEFTTNMTAAGLRKGNECIMAAKHLGPPEKLFDEFWREGELALLFGPQGTGKSILAVQVAEAIARGRGIDGFGMTEKRHKVLYVDLKLSEKQFGMRYSTDGKQYKLSENFYHDRPDGDEDLVKWLRGMVTERGFRVIVIDDLSAVRQTFDGTRETLKLMRELKRLKEELDVSILVLASSQEQRKGELISETHLQRSRVLCDAADSVFAIGVHAGNANFRYVVQTRSLSGPMKWNVSNGPVCRIKHSDEGLLGMAFDERFVAEIDEETRDLICNIKARRDAGVSYRAIAEELGIARSTAFRLHKKWTAALEKDLVVEHESEPPVVTGGPLGDTPVDPPERKAADQKNADAVVESKPTRYHGWFRHCDIDAIPFLGALKRIHVTDLKRGVDGYGRERFIEKEEEHNGRPILWYQYNSDGNLYRKERDSLGITLKRLESPWIAAVHQI